MKRIVTTMALVPVCLAVAAQSLITEIELPEMYVQSIVSPSPGSYNYPAATGEQLVMDFVAVPMTGIVDAIMDDVESQLADSGADSFLELVSVTVSSTSGRIVFDLDANVTGTTRAVHVSARGDEVSYYQSAAVFSVTPASATRLPGEQLDIVLSLSMPGELYVLKKNGSTVATRTGAGGSISFPVTVSYTDGRISDTYTVEGQNVTGGVCTVHYNEAVTGRYARADKGEYMVDYRGGSVTVRCRLAASDMYYDISDIVSTLGDGRSTFWEAGSVTEAGHDGDCRWIDVRFDFSENTASSPKTWRSVFIFDGEGNEVVFEQEARSYLLDRTNWTSTRKFTTEGGRTWAADITYYDGLGRPEQTVSKWASDDGSDIVTLLEYDDLGREARIWNPTVCGSWGLRQSPEDVRNSAVAEYGDQYPYSETVYEASVLDRVVRQWLPGEAMRTALASAETGYGSNAAGELLYGTVDDAGNLHLRDTVSAGMFLRQVRTDPDGNPAVEFRSADDRPVLVRSGSGEEISDTYFFYDVHSRLRVVCTPEGSALLSGGKTCLADGDTLRTYCYSYRYDSRGRTVERRQPGRAAEHYVYDAADNMVGYRNGELAADGCWIVYGYDAFHRQLWSGIAVSSLDRAGLQTLADTAGGLSSLRDSLDFTLLAECLYDEAPEYGYEELSYAAPSGDWPVPDTVRLKGLLTHERLAVIGQDGAATGETVERAFYYDRQSRPVQTAERNHLGRQSRVSTRYDFAGNPVEIREYHQASASSCISSCTEIRYDGRGRRTWESVETGGLPAVDMEYSYDSRDNPVAVKYTLPDTVFTEVYGYNVQGWQTASDSPYFGMELSYYDPVEIASVPSYSGNVSEWRWDYGAAGPAGGYSFLYDSQSRLTDAGAVGSAEAGTWTEKDIVYDRNGNMLSLDRYDGEDAESLVFSYSGDRLQSAAGFSGLSGGSGAVYLYDLDGNTVYDPVNGVEIGYNHMNLIGTVGRDDTVLAEYRYLADGTKLGAVDGSGNGVEYLGNAVFRRAGDSLSEESLAFSGGRVSVSGRGTTLQISPRVYLRDHLGSTRVIVDNDGEVLERDSYYPFGLRRPDSAPTDSLNRYRYNGKEEQSFAGLPYLDYGARMYDPATARWLSPDPLSDQYYSLSPYSFCAGNPINYVDPDGMDIWSINRSGEINWIESSEEHRLYSLNNNGTMSSNYITVSNRTILDALSSKTDLVSYTGSDSVDDIFKIFKFVADHSNVEWVVHKNEQVYTIGTTHNRDNSGSWGDYGISRPQASLHSHPEVPESMTKELESMGFLSNVTVTMGDWESVLRDVRVFGKQIRMNYVYFPGSTRLYHVEYYGPRYIRTIGTDYRRFYFGTLNDK